MATLKGRNTEKGALAQSSRSAREDAGRVDCFLKFRISGILKVVKFNKSQDLSNIKKLPDKKLSFHFFANLGEELSSYWNVALSLADRSEWNVSGGSASFCPPLELANEQLPSEEVGGPQATIFASCCSNFEMRSS